MSKAIAIDNTVKTILVEGGKKITTQKLLALEITQILGFGVSGDDVSYSAYKGLDGFQAYRTEEKAYCLGQGHKKMSCPKNGVHQVRS